MRAMRGADLVVRTLTTHGVRTVFALSGNQIMPNFDALVGVGIRLIHVRHEAAAVYMAEAWAQITGEIGVALLTAGPGFANGLSALYSARASETPVLLLSGDAPHEQFGFGAFQEMDQTAAAVPFVKAARKVESASEIGAALAEAIVLTQSGRPGPVHVALPFDILNATAGTAAPSPPVPLKAAELDPAAAADLAERIAKAERPLTIVGPHLCRTRHADDLAAFGAALHVPVVGMESPRGLNDTSLGAFAEVLGRADLILLLGKALDFMLDFGRAPAVAADCRFLQIDPDEAVIERSRQRLGERLAAAHCADAPASVSALRTTPPPEASPARQDWLVAVREAIDYRPAAFSAGVEGNAAEGVHPIELCRAAQTILDKGCRVILVADGGEFGQWARACLSAPRRIGNGPSGAIGAAIPYAIAARLADPEAVVVALTGDGAAGFHIAEFDTAVRHQAPFVAIVGNDARWNAEFQIQLRDYGPDRLLGCELLATRYDRVAQAFFAFGEWVETAGELAPALDRALGSNQPACLNVRLAGQPAPRLRRAPGRAG